MADNNNNFATMDKLVEFGMGLAVAKQMTSAMNEMLDSSLNQVKGTTYKNIQAPGQAPLQPKTSVVQFYAVFEGKQAGPFSESEFSSLIAERKVTKETLVWMQGMTDWKKAEDVPQILKLIALCPPPINS